MDRATVGPYEIVRPLGSGGMGEVFLGLDTRLQRQVALKRIVAADDAREQVLREARAAARLSHPHIAAVYDVVDLPDGAWIVMEYVDGESLATRVARGPLNVPEAIEIGRALASAIAAAHHEGVVHRDLKPSNVQLTRDGSAKVLDFGVAKLTSLNTLTSTRSDVSRAETMIVPRGNPGTPAYMAPERLLGRGADERSDVYGLGALLYEMATGCRPYRSRDVLSLVEEIAAGEPTSARARNPHVPRWLSDVIARALKRDPATRLQSAAELEAALARGSQQSKALRLIGSIVPGTSSRAGKLATAALVVVIGLLVAVPVVRRARDDRPQPARPAVLAILPVDNPSGDPNADYLGAGFAAVVAGNFGSIPGLTVLSRATTAPYQNRRNDLDALQRELGATSVLDLMITAVTPRVELIARLRKPGVLAPVWDQTIAGNALDVEKALLTGLSRALSRAVLARRPSDVESARLEKLPTTSADALLAYSEARAILQSSSSGPSLARAVDRFQDAIAKDSRFTLAHAGLAEAYAMQYEREKDPSLIAKATAAVDAALRIDPDQAQVYAALGAMYQQTGRYEDAIKALRRASELQPDSDDSHRLLGRVLMSKGDYDAAVAEMQTAIRIRPSWSNYFNLGLVEYFAGRYEEALDAYRRTTAMNPTYAPGFQALGTTFHVLGDLPQAIGNYEHAVRLSPEVAPAYNNLGFAYYAARRFDDAVKAFKQAIALRPNSVLYYRNVADAYRSLGQFAAARDAYLSAIRLAESALKVNPRDVESLGLLAVCEARLGRKDLAERHASEVVAIAPESRDALVRSAQVHTVLNEPDAALRDLAAAIQHGYSRRMAMMDDDLQPLRRLPAFESLVADKAAAPTRR